MRGLSRWDAFVVVGIAVIALAALILAGLSLGLIIP